MSNININIDAGTSKKLLTAGKYCAQNILVNASDSSEELAAAFITNEIDVTSFPSGVTKIPDYKFYYAKNLEGVTRLPDTITSIGTRAFESSDISLTALPANLTTLGNSAFANCYNVNLTALPSGLTSIGNSCFQYTGIVNLTVPAGISIDYYAFMNSQLATLTFAGKPSNINGAALGYTTGVVINCPWAEGEVEGAPWGAKDAIINYNYQG